MARSAPDGNTLLVGSNGPLTVNPFVQAKLRYSCDVGTTNDTVFAERENDDAEERSGLLCNEKSLINFSLAYGRLTKLLLEHNEYFWDWQTVHLERPGATAKNDRRANPRGEMPPSHCGLPPKDENAPNS